MVDVVCVGCGKDLTHEPKNRCNPQAERCADAIKVWRRLFMQVEDETMAASRVDPNELLSVCKLCRHCVSVLQRLHKLELNANENVHDAIKVLNNSGILDRCSSSSSSTNSSCHPPAPKRAKFIHQHRKSHQKLL